jgi:hypothetical protein
MGKMKGEMEMGWALLQPRWAFSNRVEIIYFHILKIILIKIII